MKAIVSYTATVDQELFNIISTLTGVSSEELNGDAQYNSTIAFDGEKLYKYLPQMLVLFGKFKRIASEIKAVQASEEFTTLAQELLNAINVSVRVKGGDKVFIGESVNLAEACKQAAC